MIFISAIKHNETKGNPCWSRWV